ncbi:MAG: LamG domain-containing protein [Gammaproteobacteria bacterium]|nr:LamG domain-containing protein [Gammaproteobacteria bacterium]
MNLEDPDDSTREAEFTITVKDGPGPVVSLDLASGARVPEGVPAAFRLGLRPALPYPVRVAVLVREEGTAFDNGAPDPYPGHVLPRHRGEFVVEIPANASNAVHSVPTRSQSFLERDTTVHLLVMKPTAGVRSIARNLPASRGGGVELGSYVTDGANTATVTVLDGNDSPSAVTPEVRLHVHPEDTEVAEGGTIEFWLAMKPQPASDLAVSIDIEDGVRPNSSVKECGSFLAAGAAGRRAVTVKGHGGGPPRQGWNWVRFTAATVDDGADEADCDVVATIASGSGYRPLNAYQDRARVRVTDNDEAGSSQDGEVVRPTVTLTRGAASVTEGGAASFTLTADRRPHDPLPVWVDYKETRGSGASYRATGGSAQVVIPRRGLSATWTLATEDDDVWLADGAATAALRPGDGYAVGEPSSATVAIIEDDPQEEDSDQEAEDPGQEEAEGSPPAPLAHWRLDGDAADSAGSSHGTLGGGASFTADAALGSHALSLDGAGGHVDLGAHASGFPLGDSARSVTGWFRAGAGAQGQTFLAYGPGGRGEGFRVTADRTRAAVAVGWHNWGASGLGLSEGWHHVAVVYPGGGDSSTILVYVDGTLRPSATLAGSPRTVGTLAGAAYIGRNSSSPDQHYGGGIDDVRLYGHALSAEQVAAVHAGTDAASATSLRVPLLPSASDPLRGGLVRLENRSGRAGTVAIGATDDAGRGPAPLSLELAAGAAVELTALDLERGAPGKGLARGLGPGAGAWRLELSSALDVAARAFARAAGGRLLDLSAATPAARTAAGAHSVPRPAPASGDGAPSLLRVVNRSAAGGEVALRAFDAQGRPQGTAALSLGAGAAVVLDAWDLAQGSPAKGLSGGLGAGSGGGRLELSSGLDLLVLPLLAQPGGAEAGRAGPR